MYTDPKTGTTYTSPEVAAQYGVNVGTATSGTPIQTQQQQAYQALPQNLGGGGATYQAPAQTQVAQPTSQPTQAPVTSPTSTPGSNPFALSQVMTALENQYKTNNSLMTNRNIALNVLYGMPVSPDDLAKLDPTLQNVLKSGDKNQIEMQIRLINDQVSGRANTLDQSVQFLTNNYVEQQKQLDAKKTDSINTVMQFVQTYGPQAKQALTSLYGQDFVNNLASQGVNIDEFAKQNLLQQIQTANVKTPYVAVGSEILDAKTGEGFTDPADFQAKTGMTLDQAGAKGLITTLNQTASGVKSGDTQIVTAGGRSLLVNKLTGETIKDLGAAYKDGSGSNSGSNLPPVSDRIAEVSDHLDSVAGQDGYVSPQDWAAAEKAWVQAGYGSATNFKTNFKVYINPADPKDYV